MNRRDFFRVAGAGTLAAVRRPSFAQARAQRPPNLLFLWTDQQRPDTLGCMGNRQAQTPNLDALARDSVVFENTRVTHPVCTPSRSALLTGRWPHQTGVTANNIPLPRKVPCLPELLARRDDYATGYLGKWHLGDEVFAQHGFRTWVSIEDNYERYFSAGRDRAARSDYHYYLVAQGYKPDSPRGTFKRSTACALPLEHTKPEFLARHAEDFLRNHRGNPFVLSVSYLEPHPPFLSAHRQRFDPAACPPPRTFEEELGGEMPLRYRARQAANRVTLPDLPTLRDLNAHYWGLVAQVDRSIGRILRALEARGDADNTVIIFTSDHGEQMGAHRMLGKGVMYEESVRVPLFLKAPGLRAGRVASPVSQIDLLPTVLDLLGSPAAGLSGQSWRPMLEGHRATPAPVFLEWSPNSKERDEDAGSVLPPGATPADLERAEAESTRTVVSPDGLKLSLRDRDRATLFDLAKDPEETVNLFGHSAYRERQLELTRAIADWQSRTGDRLPLV